MVLGPMVLGPMVLGPMVLGPMVLGPMVLGDVEGAPPASLERDSNGNKVGRGRVVAAVRALGRPALRPP
jgi:hypothetical protein